MPTETRYADWLEEIHELNRLFLSYVRARADAGQPCLGLPPRVARRLREACPKTLDRVADLPTALFQLRVESTDGSRGLAEPKRPLEQMHLSLALTILNSAWHLARSRPFEARMFLHLSARQLRDLRATPLARLPALAGAPGVLSCAFAHGGLTWPALMRHGEPDKSRMLILIALQPELSASNPQPRQADLRSVR